MLTNPRIWILEEQSQRHLSINGTFHLKTRLKIESEVFSCIIMDFLILMLQSLRLARISFLQVTAFNLRDGSKLPADMGVIGIRAHARR